MNQNQIESVVHNLINQYNTSNPVLLADKLGIVIQTGNLKKISGYSLMIHERYFIYVNEILENEKCQEVIAYELGHCILHHATQKVNDNMIAESNLFAKLLTQQN